MARSRTRSYELAMVQEDLARATVSSQQLEHGCRRIYAGYLAFFGLRLEDSGFYCRIRQTQDLCRKLIQKPLRLEGALTREPLKARCSPAPSSCSSEHDEILNRNPLQPVVNHLQNGGGGRGFRSLRRTQGPILSAHMTSFGLHQSPEYPQHGVTEP